MHALRAIVLVLSCLPSFLAPAQTAANFDANWLFLKADAPGAEQTSFTDSTWRKLDLPHDWSIEGPFAETNKTGGAGAFLPSGIGWYRKHFTLPKIFSNRLISVEFDGVMQNSDVWINGFHLGHRPYGYVSFSDDLTGHINFNGDNVLSVRCDTSEQPASRWYSGAGIYRHVRLVTSNPLHITEHGVFVTTPQVSATQALVRVEITLTNEAATLGLGNLQASLHTPDGKILSGTFDDVSLESQAGKTFVKEFTVTQPALWSLDDPNLYQANVRVSDAQQPFDSQTATFGIRDAKFIPDTGFWLNSKNFKLYGVCLHVDGGAFGAAVPISIWEARLKTLKSLGVNAIRTAHNPPAPEFLDLCDRLGFLVMDEMFDCWTVAKNPYDYHLYFDEWSRLDEHDSILRDRNHPSIILYSVGNEIHDTPQAEKAKRILGGLVAVAHAADPTRPVTQALFRPNVSHDYDDGLADLLDVVGQNYREQEILAAHEQKPARKIVGTENTHDRKQWIAMRDHAPYAGQFLWTGIDYLGESRRWPMIGHGSGLLDRTGAIRPLARERESWWSGRPMVALTRRVASTDLMPTDPGYGQEERHTQVLFSDWTPSNLKPHTENVEVYSNCKEVELFLNNKSLGSQTINADAAPRLWNVPFKSGALKAIARNDGKVVATDELHTAGKPAKIILATETKDLTPGFDNVAIIRATIVDKKGVTIPRANNLITFKVFGPGVIAAVDNADNASQELFQTNSRCAFQGTCTAFLRAAAVTTAKASKIITVTATADGLSAWPLTLAASPELSR